MTMDLSEFKPPVRLSMTDEEIFVALGKAEASEDGLAKAMAIVEEQANLRQHDNQLFSEWVHRMQTSDSPLAKIALENVERAKHGLEPLPLLMPESEPAPEPVLAFEESLIEVEIETPTVVSDEDNSDDLFDALLADAATEATGAIPVMGEAEVPAFTYSHDVVETEIEDFEVAADEDALVQEESAGAKEFSGWWHALSNIVLVTGVLFPVLISFLVADSKVSFGTAITGFVVGTLGQLGFYLASHFTGKRTENATVLTRRATFGVHGAIFPGIAVVGLSLTALLLVAIGSSAASNGAIAGLPAFGDAVLGAVTLGQLVSIGIVALAAGIIAVSGRRLRFVTAAAAALLVIGFVVVAIGTRSAIDLSAINFSIDFGTAGTIALLLSLVAAVNFHNIPKVRAVGSGLSTVWRWVGVVAAIVLLPTAVFAHFVLFYSQNVAMSGFDLLNQLLRASTFGDPALWVLLFGAVFATVALIKSLLKNLHLLGLNRVSNWWLLAVVAAAGALLVLLPDWNLWLDVARFLLVPALAAVGLAIGETIIRRGAYHEASLQRGYGFYHSFGWTGLAGFVIATGLGWGLAAPSQLFAWLGFFGKVSALAPAAAALAGLLWGAVALIPVVRSQQRAVAEVEERKASLSGFVGFTE